jgi:hypothetical protein
MRVAFLIRLGASAKFLDSQSTGMLIAFLSAADPVHLGPTRFVMADIDGLKWSCRRRLFPGGLIKQKEGNTNGRGTTKGGSQ